jgi:Fe2+ transport system protein FeoA
MLKFRLLKWFRKIHKWIGVYVGILTTIWLVEMIVLPPIFNPGLPVVDGPPLTAQYTTSAPLSLQQALQSFMDQQPGGIASVAELDEMAYLPANGVYRFAVKERFLEWYVEAKTGKILKYGFDSNRFLTEKSMLAWLHPFVAKVVKAPFELLFIFLAVTGLYIVFHPRKKQVNRLKTGSLLDMAPGEKRCLKGVSDVALMGRLAAVGILPGTSIQMIRIRNGGPVVILVRYTYLALGRDIGARIMMSREAA